MSDTPANRSASFATLKHLTWRNIRLWTGLVLFAFVATHLINHALGLVSLEAMDWVRSARVAVTRSWPGTAVLLVSAVVHMVIGITKFIERRTWRVRPIEAVQLASGLLVPLLLFRHVLGTRIAHEWFAIDDDYTYALYVMWPGEAWRQALLIALAWTHGVIGVHMWLRLKPAYRRWQWAWFALAILVPFLAFSGFRVGGELVRIERDFANPFTSEQFVALKQAMAWALWGYAGVLVTVVAYRLLATWWLRFQPRINVTYSGGPTVVSPRGLTVLEVSRAYGIPHASICGGRARCSTCRVRIIDGGDNQPPPDAAEMRVLERVGAAPNVRLACQLRPADDLSLMTLLPAQRFTTGDLASLDKYYWGVEQRVTLLFADIRGFTTLSENQLPYDVVFLLNQYLARMSDAITDAGGYVDKFMGDGIMAIFGMDRTPEQGAREALAAARDMSGVLDALNQSLREDLPEPLRIGIGVHSGIAILARIGATSSALGAGERITALGDTVNTASRLEGAAKELGVQFIVSAETLKLAGIALDDAHRRKIAVRGRSRKVDVAAYAKATHLELAATTAEQSAKPDRRSPARRAGAKGNKRHGRR